MPLFCFRCRKWALLCGRQDLLDVNPLVCNTMYKLCSDHFEPTQFYGNRLIYDALPTKFHWSSNKNIEQSSSSRSIKICTSYSLAPPPGKTDQDFKTLGILLFLFL